jgi:hypothetical protein
MFNPLKRIDMKKKKFEERYHARSLCRNEHCDGNRTSTPLSATCTKSEGGRREESAEEGGDRRREERRQDRRREESERAHCRHEDRGAPITISMNNT